MVDTRSNIQLADLNSKPHDSPTLCNLIDYAIGTHLYPPLGSGHNKILLLDKFHGPTHRQKNPHGKTNREKENVLITFSNHAGKTHFVTMEMYNIIHNKYNALLL